MRGFLIVATGGFLLASAADAQTRTPEEYLCALTDECVGEEPAEGTGTTNGDRGKARVSATRGFSLAKPGSTAAPATGRSTAASSRPLARTPVKSASANRQKPGAAASKRVDLRLSFKLGSAELTPQAMAEAQVFAKALQMPQLQSRKFLIEGHTDAQGSRDFNLDLSQRRARAVADYLSSLGVARERFQVRGYGFDRPLPGRSSAAQENRRVEAVLLS